MILTSLNVKTQGDKRILKAEFADGSSFLLSVDYLPDSLQDTSSKGVSFDVPKDGKELSPSEEDALRFAASCYRAEKASLRLISRAEQNSHGLMAKLQRKGFESAVARSVVSRFLDQNLLNDERFAGHWLNSRLSLGKTPFWLLVSLRKRGIDRDSSQKALNKLLDADTEYALLLRYLEKSAIQANEKSLRPMLKSQGFSYGVIARYLDSL